MPTWEAEAADSGWPTRASSPASESEPDTALRLADHLAELAWLAAADDAGIAEARHRVFSARADAASSTMATGIFRWAAREAQGGPGPLASGPAG